MKVPDAVQSVFSISVETLTRINSPDEHRRAAGVSANQVMPMLNAADIAELTDFAEKMPYVSRIRKEFTDAARQAER